MTDAFLPLRDWQAIGIMVAAAAIGITLGRLAVLAARARGLPRSTVRAIEVGITVVWAGIAGVAAITVLDSLDITSGLTITAIAGLAVTLALQTTLGNVISGVLLLSGRQFRLGDAVEISGVKAKVIKLGLVTTWLQRDDGALVVVSNTTLLSGPLVSHTAGARLRETS